MNKEEKEEKEEIPTEQVLGTILQMIQHMTQVINVEACKILHQTKHCKMYVSNCPLCKEEEEE